MRLFSKKRIAELDRRYRYFLFKYPFGILCICLLALVVNFTIGMILNSLKIDYPFFIGHLILFSIFLISTNIMWFFGAVVALQKKDWITAYFLMILSCVVFYFVGKLLWSLRIQ